MAEDQKENNSQDQLLKKINNELAKNNSYWRSFSLSVVKGFGFVIGAGIVAGIVIALLINIAERLNLNSLENILQGQNSGVQEFKE